VHEVQKNIQQTIDEYTQLLTQNQFKSALERDTIVQLLESMQNQLSYLQEKIANPS